MKRIARVIGLPPENLGQYIKLHNEIFPEVVEALKKANIKNYSIYYHKGQLFSYMEYFGDDFNEDMKNIGHSAVLDRWQELTEALQRSEEDRPDDIRWTDIDEVFHME